MNTKIKKTARRLFVAFYKPFIVRKEKIKATRMWQKGVKECINIYKETRGPRFYLWFDTNTSTFFPVTLEPRPKKDCLSMRELIRMGKIKAKRRIDVEDIKRECFYYTPSRWGGIGCESDNALRIEKYNKWLTFYMNNVSIPMRKLKQTYNP